MGATGVWGGEGADTATGGVLAPPSLSEAGPEPLRTQPSRSVSLEAGGGTGQIRTHTYSMYSGKMRRSRNAVIGETDSNLKAISGARAVVSQPDKRGVGTKQTERVTFQSRGCFAR